MTKSISALRFVWLTPVYDPALDVAQGCAKRLLLAQTQIAAGQRVFDLAASGTLTVMIKQACRGGDVMGLDGDLKVLAIPREKRPPPAWRIRSIKDWRPRCRMMTPRSTVYCPA